MNGKSHSFYEDENSLPLPPEQPLATDSIPAGNGFSAAAAPDIIDADVTVDDETGTGAYAPDELLAEAGRSSHSNSSINIGLNDAQGPMPSLDMLTHSLKQQKSLSELSSAKVRKDSTSGSLPVPTFPEFVDYFGWCTWDSW